MQVAALDTGCSQLECMSLVYYCGRDVAKGVIRPGFNAG